MLKVKVVPDGSYSSLSPKKSPSYAASFKTHTLLKQLTQQTPITVDGLPAFVPASRWIIDPHDHWVRYWDVVIMILLVYTATVTPFEVSFLSPHLNVLFGINRLVDACFLADMFIQALLGFLDRKKQRWETRPRITVKRYCKRWLVIDTLSVLPYDAVVILIPSHVKLKLLRLLRLLRLVRLVRMIRLARIFRRWESHIGISYSHLKLIRFSVAVLVCAHWLACGFYLVVVLEDSALNWVVAYSSSDAGNSNMGEPFDNYIIALYWSVMTMSTIGYGDVSPKTRYERIYEIFGMILGASVYAYMVGAICSIVASMNAVSAEFNQQMDSLNAFMSESQLPPALRARLREYFRYRRSARSLHDCPALLQAMSPALRAQVASHTQAKWVNTVPFFRPLPEYLKTEIALALRTEAYAPNEPVVREGDKCNRLFIVDQGLLSSKGRLLGCGAIVGEQHFLLDKGRWSHSANTVTYTRLLTLDKDTFDEMLLRYPVAKKSIRKHALRSALRENLVCYTYGLRHVREHMGSAYLPSLLPSKQDLGGGHLSQHKYHRILSLVVEAEPEALEPLESAATIIQKHWRGVKARRMRRLMQHVVTGSIIQSRAAHYHTSAAHQHVSAAMLRQFAASSVHSDEAHDYVQPCTSTPAAASALDLPQLQPPADLPQQQLPTAAALPMQSRKVLLPHISPGPHVAWVEQTLQGGPDHVGTTAMSRQMLTPTAASVEQLNVSGQQPLAIAGSNMLDQAARRDELMHSKGHSYLIAVEQYRQQMERSLEALKQEMEAIQCEILSHSGVSSWSKATSNSQLI